MTALVPGILSCVSVVLFEGGRSPCTLDALCACSMAKQVGQYFRQYREYVESKQVVTVLV